MYNNEKAQAPVFFFQLSYHRYFFSFQFFISNEMLANFFNFCAGTRSMSNDNILSFVLNIRMYVKVNRNLKLEFSLCICVFERREES